MAKNKIDLKKAKLDKELKLEVEYSEQTHDGAIDHSVKGAVAVHNDLRIAFNAIGIHAVKIAELYNDKGEFSAENIAMRGIYISDGKNAGYIFSFLRELSTGHKMNINTPLLSVDSEKYDDMDELIELVRKAGDEVRAYLFEGKNATSDQGNLFKEGEDSEGESN